MAKHDYRDAEIAARHAARARAFDLCDERPTYEALQSAATSLSSTALEMCALKLGPSFIYVLYVHTTRLLHARNLCRGLYALTKGHPFAPYINIVETPEYGEGEWALEANGKRVGSDFPW